MTSRRGAEPASSTVRRRRSERITKIVVTVDEIAGDGAVVPFVHAIADWLQQEFAGPFADAPEANPFRIVLVLADASLANAATFQSYLQHQVEAPEKVFVGPSTGSSPFRISRNIPRLGGHRLPVLHAMDDGYPAKPLPVEYHVRLDPVTRAVGPDGSTGIAANRYAGATRASSSLDRRRNLRGARASPS